MIDSNKLNELVEVIVKNYSPLKIFLFGSYAHGNPSRLSDLDLLIIKNVDVPSFKRAREVRKFLWGITDIPKDIVVCTEQELNEWKNVEDAFCTTAIKTGRIIYEKQE